ncbi:acetyl-CoA carboxylase biotin carboxylase subunit family protein [Caenispirillum salinarum]|uniref:ATP-grasp domain-containing protein n=1 Tax=Caenispirillum salinarum TaxID=859058 RepID=UPI003850AA61
MTRHVFIIGLDDLHLAEARSIRGAEDIVFHGLIPYHDIVHPSAYPIEALLATGRAEMAEAPSVDAIIGHWDFPTTSLLPILRREHGLPGPTLESVLLCENKYWGRLAHAAAVPECTPPFALVDPAAPDAAERLPLSPPFWLKPTVAFSSYLGFRIETAEQYRDAIVQVRDNIGLFAEPFAEIAAHAEHPEALPGEGGGDACIAEGIIGGELCTLEGYVLDGDVQVYGVLDSLRGSNNVSFLSYQLPSHLPGEVQARMADAAARVLRHIGLDDTPFNMEFFWDRESDRVWLLEINPRISKSHCALFRLVMGASHHEVAVNVAFKRRPDFPRRDGPFPMAGKFMPRTYGDAVVLRVPGPDDIAAVAADFPEMVLHMHIQEGTRLSDLPAQDSYSFEIADLFIGAGDEAALHDKFHTIMERLDFRFSEVVPTNYGRARADTG